jgi:replicative DNA helicase
VTSARSEQVWKVGQKAVFKVQLASGRCIRATAEHRLLTGAGWTTVSALKEGDRLALARRLPEPAQPKRWPDHWLLLLAHLVGDGSYPEHQPLRYTTASEENSAAVRGAAEMFGCRVTRNEGAADRHQLIISGNGNRWSPLGVGKWLRDLGIFGQRSHQKQLPTEVFTLSNGQIALLLRHLWATDGTIAVRKPPSRAGHSVSFATCSHRLAQDVGALLLRLGIVSRTQTVKVGHYRPVYVVCVSGAEAQKTFLQQVGAFGPRCEGASELLEALHNPRADTDVEVLPLQAAAAAGAQVSVQGMSRRPLARMSGAAPTAGGQFRVSAGPAKMASYAALSDPHEQETVPTADVFWDRVLAVTPDGEEEVFDLTVPGPACWLADGIASHNSGSLEQDSDMILLIYREELYDRNTTKKGIAEIDLVKHRNGETGTFLLTFQGQYTRFANYVSDSYAEGVLR